MKRFKDWKPIHLCWLFRKLHLPIPRYLIGGGSAFFLQGGRIANATRVWQAAQDVDVIDWTKTNDFIVAAMFETDAHGSSSTTFYLHWRNVTDGGSFASLGSSGELTYNADTDLVDGNAVIHSEEGITARYPANHEDGKEIEGISFKIIILLKEWHEEFQFAVDCNNAHDGDEYEFAIYDSEAATYVGTLTCTITMAAAEGETYYETLPATEVSSLSLVLLTTFAKLLAITEVAIPGITRTVDYYRSLIVTEVSVPTISLVKSFYRTLSVTESSVVSLTKKLFKTLSIAESSVVSLVAALLYTKAMAATESSVPTVSLIMIYRRLLAVTSVSSLDWWNDPILGWSRTCDGDYHSGHDNIQSSVSKGSFSLGSYSKSSHDTHHGKGET